MQGYSARYEDLIRRSHTPVVRGDILDENGLVEQQLLLTGGAAKSDRMAALRTDCDVEIVDPDKSINYKKLLTGKRIQLYRGVELSSTDLHDATFKDAASWAVSGKSTGVWNGVTVDGDGALTLGP